MKMLKQLHQQVDDIKKKDCFMDCLFDWHRHTFGHSKIPVTHKLQSAPGKKAVPPAIHAEAVPCAVGGAPLAPPQAAPLATCCGSRNRDLLSFSLL